MRVWIIAASGLAAAGLSGCQPKNGGDVWSPHPAGRYAGVGVYPAGPQWSKIAVSNRPKDSAAALTKDDGHVIVVVDSRTGEVRQCGNLSGYCIGLNPWTAPLSPTQTEPVPLTAHASSADETAAPASSGSAPHPPRGRDAKSGGVPAQAQ